jgi:putative hydrolase of the HAD superfamily
MARLRAVVFDVGGTLLCPAQPVGETYAQFARPHGVKLHADTVTEAFHHAMKTTAREAGTVPSDGNDRAWWKQVVKHSLPGDAFARESDFDQFFEEVYLYYARPEAWELFPEVVEVLHNLRDFPVELVAMSNWDGRLHPVLDGCELGEFFSHRFISTELGWEKPDTAIYRHVAESLNLPPHSLLSVGDDKARDVDGARKAGWQALHIDRPKTDLWATIKLLSGSKKISRAL